MNDFVKNSIDKFCGNRVLTDREMSIITKHLTDLNDMEMYCPNCIGKLECSEWFDYYDCGFKTESPKYVCTNKLCDLSGGGDVCWNSHGDIFGDYEFIRKVLAGDTDELDYALRGFNTSAYNSLSRKQSVEIFKDGLRNSIYLPKILCLFMLRPVIIINYRSNAMGDVVGKNYKLRFLTNRGTYYISGLSSLLYGIKLFYRLKREYDTVQSYNSAREILALFDDDNIDMWHFRLMNLLFNKLYKKFKSKLINSKNIVS